MSYTLSLSHKKSSVKVWLLLLFFHACSPGLSTSAELKFSWSMTSRIVLHPIHDEIQPSAHFYFAQRFVVSVAQWNDSQFGNASVELLEQTLSRDGWAAVNIAARVSAISTVVLWTGSMSQVRMSRFGLERRIQDRRIDVIRQQREKRQRRRVFRAWQRQSRWWSGGSRRT